jgi:YD repeat-containing protein
MWQIRQRSWLVGSLLYASILLRRLAALAKLRQMRSHESGTPAVSTNHYNAKGQLDRSVDPDGVTTLFTYNALGEQTASAVDMNRNGSIGLAGPDRVTTTNGHRGQGKSTFEIGKVGKSEPLKFSLCAGHSCLGWG